MNGFERHFFNVALTIWCIFAVVVVALMLWNPGGTVMQTYAQASREFWAGIVPPQNFMDGYYYLPASQILYTPFALLGDRAGGLFLQSMGFGLTTWAAWELARLLVPERAEFAFAIVLLLLIPGVAGVLRTVQLDAPMWALTALAASAIARERHWLAAAALALALAIKPTAIVALLLMGAVWWSVGVRLAPMVVGVLLVPFLVADWEFVVRLYVGLADRITGAVSQPRNWNDLGNMLNHVGLPVPFGVMFLVRVAAAVATLGIAWTARRRLSPPVAAFSAFSLAALYLLLFNPRTEGGGYAGLSLVAAPLAARMMLLEGRSYLAATLMCACVLMGLPGLTPITMKLFGVWMKPLVGSLMTIFVLVPRALDPRRWQAVIPPDTWRSRRVPTA